MKGGFSRAVLFIAIALDICLAALHCVSNQWPGLFPNHIWSLEAEGGIAESLQYGKWALLALTFLAAAWVHRVAGYLGWAALFFYLLLDDSMQLHEHAGALFAAQFEMAWLRYLKPGDIGELVFSAGIGLLFLVFLILVRSFGAPDLRRASLHMLMLMVLLAVFGVGVDMLHSAFRDTHRVSTILGTVEDGGEMLAASLMLAYAVSLLRRSAMAAAFSTPKWDRGMAGTPLV